MKKSLFIILFFLALARIFIFPPERKLNDVAYAAYCSAGCPASCTTIACCCGPTYTLCDPCDTCSTSCPCTPNVDGVWGACSVTTLKSLCGTKNCNGTQICTPAGGYQTCCIASTATVTFSADYPGTAATASPFGQANGTLNITGGTTTVTGATLDFGVLSVTTGYLSVTATGIAKTSATCVN